MNKHHSPVMAVAEIVINVRDIGKMREFYEEVVGFEFFRQYPQTNPTIAFLTITDLESPLGQGGHPQFFALIDAQRHPPAQARFQGINQALSSFNHAAFEISATDYEGEKQRLEMLGLEVREERFPDMNAKALFFTDPEENLLEFICHDDASG